MSDYFSVQAFARSFTGVAGSLVLFTGVLHADVKAPPEIASALGWQTPAGKKAQSPNTGSISVFSVSSEPSKWPVARRFSAEWMADAPPFEQYPAGYVFRELTKIQALMLSASDPKAAEELRAERVKIEELIVRLQALEKSPGNSAARMKTLTGRLTQMNQAIAEWLADSLQERVKSFRSGLTAKTINVPDLVSWVGEKETAPLLVEAFATKNAIELDGHTATGRLAADLLKKGELKAARIPWTLIEWPARIDRKAAHEISVLYDALNRQSPDLLAPATDDRGYVRSHGLGILAYGLAIDGRMDEATAVLKAAGTNQYGFGYRGQPTKSAASIAFDLVAKVAGAEPKSADWRTLNTLAIAGGRMDDLFALATRRFNEEPAGSVSAQVWQTRRGWSLIAADKIDEGLALLAPASGLLLDERYESLEDERASSIARMLKLAHALPRVDIGDRLMADLTPGFLNPQGVWWDHVELVDAFTKQLLQNKDYGLLEKILRGRFELGIAAKEKKSERANRSDVDRIKVNELVWQLADVLGREGKHGRVVGLFSESPYWAQKDVSQMLTSRYNKHWRPEALILADSLAEVGRKADAIAILEAYLIQNRGSDPAYALYVKVVGDEALPFLDKLFANEPFEERPLIWKASLQLAAGKTKDAERTIKQAIAIDPSDGEQPKDDRMRAYAVLREVALKQGDKKQAAFLANVVASIRRSENADDLVAAGLAVRGASEYNAALGLFSDAYCIQSRLARQLARQNRTQEAAEHYKRAFELMPDSFGRVESHCFGCEQAFANAEAQNYAEIVFLKLAKNKNAKPQVYYLLGYLRMEQERWEEAAGYFTEAVKRDPDYLNAWKNLATVLPKTLRPRAELDRAQLRLAALDPAGRRVRVNLDAVRDLPALWQTYAQTSPVALTVPRFLFPLGPTQVERTSDTRREVEPTELVTVASRFGKHPVLKVVTEALDDVRVWADQ